MAAKAAFGITGRLSVSDEKEFGYGHLDSKYKAAQITLNLEIVLRLRSHANGLGLKFLRLIMRPQGVDELIDLAFHHEIELVNGQADAMVGYAILLEVICADLLRAVAGTDHRFAFRRESIVLLLLFDLLQASTQDPHRLFAILDLRFFILH